MQRLSNTKTAQKQVLTSLGGSPSDDWSTYAECLSNICNEPNIQDVSGEGAVSWDKGVHCVLPEVIVGGKAVQDGTPTPDAPVMPEFSEGTEVVSRGKNLFDADAFFEYYHTANLAAIENRIQKVVENGRNCFRYAGGSGYKGGYIEFPVKQKEKTQYAISFTAKQASEQTQAATTGLGFVYSDGSRTTVYAKVTTEWHENALVSTANKTVVGLFFPYNNAGFIFVDIDTIQLAEGPTATPYTPYFDGGSATAPELLAIPGTEYRDEWNPQTGKGVRRVGKLVLDGTEAWRVMNGTYPIFYIQGLPAPLWDTGISLLLQGRYSHGAYRDSDTTDPGAKAFVYQTGIMRIRGPETITTVDAWKAYLAAQRAAGTPVTVWYVLKEPIEFQTDPAPLTAPKGAGQIMQTGGTLDGVPISAKYIDASNLQETVTITADPAGVSVRPSDGYPAIVDAIIAAEPNFQPWNIAAGIEIWGKTGTARLYVKPGGTDWPFPDADDNDPTAPPTEDALDSAYRKQWGEDPPDDYMVLVDNEGNITKGYFFEYGSVGLAVDNTPGWGELPTPSAYGGGTLGKKLVVKSGAGLSNGRVYYSGSWRVRNGTMSVSGYDKISSIENKAWSTPDYIRGAGSEMGTSSIIWSNTDIFDEQGNLVVKGSDQPYYTGFGLTQYDQATTEFKAIGWRRVSKHTTGESAGQITADDFTMQESGGWNYLKNIRICTRKNLFYTSDAVWPEINSPFVRFISDMNRWAKNEAATNAFLSIDFDEEKKENTCLYHGVGGHEHTGFTCNLKMGVHYGFSFDYYCPSGVTGEYEEPYAPFFGFFHSSVLVDEGWAHILGPSVKALPTSPMTGYQRFVCYYTPPVDGTYAVVLGFGSTLDGADVEFFVKNAALWEMPQRKPVLLMEAASRMAAGSLRSTAAHGYVGDVTNRLRCGLTESNGVTIPAGTTVTVFPDTYYNGSVDWAMWFINSSGIEKIAAGADLVEGTDFIDTKWMTPGMTYVVPEDTQRVWLNFRRYDNSDLSLSALMRYDIYEVP